jgi:myosin heavy subunit
MKLRLDAELALAQAIKEEKAGQDALIQLANEVEEVVDRETQVLRELLTDSERALNEAQELVGSLDREAAQYRTERHQVEQDIARLQRMASAGQRLANIEFVVCPRCTQSLTQREVPDEICRVCMQHDNVKDLTRGQYETAQLADQVEEVDLQLSVIARQSSEAAAAVQNRKKLVASLTTQIESRTASRVTPRLQAYTDAAAKAARAKAQQEHLEEVLQRWDRANDLQIAAETLESQRSTLRTAIGAAKSALEERRRDVLSQLTDEFATTVAAFRIPAGQGAAIDPKTYLPLLDGQPFNQVSSAGGIATATQVAYWMSLVAVATRLNDTVYPAFLMIDSPRLAVSSSEDISGQMYSRFVTQVGVMPGRWQFIIADNEMPKDYVREFTEFKYS